MCGITGFFTKKYNLDHLKKMTNTLVHRGPDADGFYFNEDSGIGLGHRRLSILDLSSEANQPFHSNCNRYVIVLNGEIYNYKEIANELATKSKFIPKTSSDTEVVIEAFCQWGINFVNKLNGMFAIAIWDKQTEELLLLRDRIGIKPLYYYSENSDFAFASEMKAIIKLVPKENLTTDINSVFNFLHLGYTSGESSIFNEIKKLPSGSYLKISKDKAIEIIPYWDLKTKVTKELIEDEVIAKTELKNKITTAVEKRLVSDVPLGTFLSGGIDSSLVSAVAQDISDQPIDTFCIGFEENKFDESTYAKEVANHLGTKHHEYILTKQNVLDQIDVLLSVYDEPFADSSAIPSLLVSQIAKKHVSVALSGDGGDEQFLGYGMYQWAKRLNQPFVYPMRKVIAAGLNLTNNNRLKRGAKVFNAPSKKQLKSHVFSQEQYLFSSKEISNLLIPESTALTLNESWDLARRLNPMEEQAFFDLNYYLKDDLLVKMDRASMHHSLEVRVPLLDHEVISYSLNISPKLKYKGGTSKYLLKEILYDYAPEKFFNRPKQGFSIPLIKWLKTDLKFLSDYYLSKEVIESTGLVHFHVVQSLVDRYNKGEDYLYNRIWGLIILHKSLND